MKMIIYRCLSVLLVINMIVIVYFLTLANVRAAWICIALIPAILLLQIFIVRCNKCGCSPGLRLLAIWTLLMDFELYFADTLLLRKCPKCGSNLKENR